MSIKNNPHNTPALLKAIVEGIERKKGLDIIQIDLQPINHSEFDYFIICHGNSTTQVGAIADSVEDTVFELTGEKLFKKDGYVNKLWIALAFTHTVVHIFQHDTRYFYDLEHLWADAKIKKITTDEKKTNSNEQSR
ncbi:MAG: ribosome silencing factor [Mangrovibacterium sp.]